MYVSSESHEQMDRRLRRVLRRAEWHILPGTFAFVEYPRREFPMHLIDDALALVRDNEVWSALVPSEDPKAEAFAVFRFHFAPNEDNSGFVGWLASHLKRTLGTGLFVVCGQNSERGGIFDYWGAPVALGQQVLAAVAGLRECESPRAQSGEAETQPSGSDQDPAGPPMNLDAVVMRVTETSELGVVDSSTHLRFRQRGRRVMARYSGGSVVRGCLAGTLVGANVQFRFVQREASGQLHAGTSRCELTRLTDGRLRLVEHFRWSTRAGEGVNLFEEQRWDTPGTWD